MTLYIASLAVLTLIIIVQSIMHHLHSRAQQRTIDALTDKLMVRMGHREYRQDQPMMVEEKPKRKPLSYYDDPNIDEEEVTM